EVADEERAVGDSREPDELVRRQGDVDAQAPRPARVLEDAARLAVADVDVAACGRKDVVRNSEARFRRRSGRGGHDGGTGRRRRYDSYYQRHSDKLPTISH